MAQNLLKLCLRGEISPHLVTLYTMIKFVYVIGSWVQTMAMAKVYSLLKMFKAKVPSLGKENTGSLNVFFEGRNNFVSSHQIQNCQFVFIQFKRRKIFTKLGCQK